jgi:hypothetical protein
VSKRINIILDDEFYELLRNEAFANRTSMAKIINNLLKRHYELPVNSTKPFAQKIKEQIIKKDTKGDLPFT